MALPLASTLASALIVPQIIQPPSFHHTIVHQTIARTTAAADRHAMLLALKDDVSLSNFLDSYEAPKAGAEANKAAAEYQKKAAKEAAVMGKAAEATVKRMEAATAAKAAQQEALLASGVPPCPEGKFGSDTGVLTSKVCARVRDGGVESRAKTGAFLIF